MNFHQWQEKADKERSDSFRRKYKGQAILSGNALELHNQFFFTHKIIHSNKSLVWATWILAIATIILSVLTLFIK